MITGASRGLGLEFVKQILAFPSPPEVVIAACRSPGSATELQQMVKEHSNLKIVKLDIEKDEDIAEALKEVEMVVGKKGLNILINNAGIYDQSNAGNLSHLTRDMMHKHFDVNVIGHLMVTQTFLPLLELAVTARGSKHLDCRAQVVMVTASSQTQTYRRSKPGTSTSLHYKCSKTALTMASIVLSRELGAAGIHVLPLHPGWVRSDMGGPGGFLSVEESITACLKVIGSASPENTGKLLSYDGSEIPY